MHFRQTNMKTLKSRFRWVLYVGVVALPVAAYLFLLQVSHNFHEVVPGELYRSAQLDDDDLTKYAKKYHLKSVLNLRGERVGKEWYENEVAEARAAKIQYINFKMNASRELTRKEALELIEVMRKAPKPMLIHCQAGADRTGLASAIYLAAIKKDSEFDAEFQLSIYYGHIPFWFADGYAMNETFEDLELYLGYHDS